MIMKREREGLALYNMLLVAVGGGLLQIQLLFCVCDFVNVSVEHCFSFVQCTLRRFLCIYCTNKL